MASKNELLKSLVLKDQGSGKRGGSCNQVQENPEVNVLTPVNALSLTKIEKCLGAQEKVVSQP